MTENSFLKHGFSATSTHFSYIHWKEYQILFSALFWITIVINFDFTEFFFQTILFLPDLWAFLVLVGLARHQLVAWLQPENMKEIVRKQIQNPIIDMFWTFYFGLFLRFWVLFSRGFFKATWSTGSSLTLTSGALK